MAATLQFYKFQNFIVNIGFFCLQHLYSLDFKNGLYSIFYHLQNCYCQLSKQRNRFGGSKAHFQKDGRCFLQMSASSSKTSRIPVPTHWKHSLSDRNVFVEGCSRQHCCFGNSGSSYRKDFMASLSLCIGSGFHFGKNY